MSVRIAEKFETSMKTGFLVALILIVLERNPSYGYKIGKEIEKRTLGLWEIPSSTLYTVLKDMTKKKLISYNEEQVEGRNRKVYEITQKGHTTLNIMLEKKNIADRCCKRFFLQILLPQLSWLALCAKQSRCE